MKSLVLLTLLAGSSVAADTYVYNLLERTELDEVEMTRESLLWKAGKEGWKFQKTYDESGAAVDRMISFSTEHANFDALLGEDGSVHYLVEHAGAGIDFTLGEAFGAIHEHVKHFTSEVGWESLRPVDLTPSQRIDLFNAERQAVYAGFSIPLQKYVVAILLIEVPMSGPGEPIHDEFDVLIVYDLTRQLLGKRYHD